MKTRWERIRTGMILLPVLILAAALTLALSACGGGSSSETAGAEQEMSETLSCADSDEAEESDPEEADAETAESEESEPDDTGEQEAPETVLEMMVAPVRLVYTQQYETSQQYETEDPLLIDACAQALRDLQIGSETDERTTDSDDVLTFTAADGSTETVRFQNGGFCYGDRVYEVSDFSEVREVLQQIANAVSQEVADASGVTEDPPQYGVAEIPEGYSIYRNEAADYSFLHISSLQAQLMTERAGVLFYTDDAHVDYFCVFADSSEGLTPEAYLEQVGDHFKQIAASQGYEIWQEPTAADPLTLNGRTLQGIRYGYALNGVRFEYTDYIEEVLDGRENNVMVYEQHVQENSGDTAVLALQDAVASYAPQADFYGSLE